MRSDLNPEPKRAAPSSKWWQSTFIWLIGTLVVAVLAILAVVIVYTVFFEKKTPTTAQTPAPASSTVGAAPTVEPGCTNFKGSMTAPTQLKVDAMALESPVVVVGKDKEGNPGAPEKDEPYTTAWYNRSAAPGNEKGNVILTIHTFHEGAALGNELMDPKHGLEPGDVLKVRDVDGNQVCYQFSEKKKIQVDEYDPESGVFHNLEGPPQLAIMVCDDWDPKTEEWNSRVIFYAPLV